MSEVDYSKYFDIGQIVQNILAYMPNFDKEKFLKAYEFAEEAHRGQFRKDNLTPYIVHPISVVKILKQLHVDEDVLISALLHDVPEDTSRTIEEVKEKFGDSVAFLVDGITKLSKVQYRNEMKTRDVESLKKLFLHTAKDPRVLIIKLADRLHNMRTLENVRPDKQTRIARETLEIFIPVANLLGIQILKSQLEDLCFKHLFPTEYLNLKTKMDKISNSQKQSLEKFISVVESLLNDNKLSAKIVPRKDKLYSIYKKLCSCGKTIDDVENRMRIDVIVENRKECYEVLGIIHSKFIPRFDKFRDYIANPKMNGYQSIHTVVFGINGIPTEVHIYTKIMNFEAEYGISAQFFMLGQNKVKKSSVSKIFNKDVRSSWVSRVLEIEKNLKGLDFLETLKSDVLQERIVVFSPKGKSIDLPKDASAIDFAFAIHSDIGIHSNRAVINGNPKPISTPLNAGDVVKIETEKHVYPALHWLHFTKTSQAQNKIKFFLRKSSIVKRIKEGSRFLQKEFDIAELGIYKETSLRKINTAMDLPDDKKFKSWNDLFAEIGSGNISASSVAKSVSVYKEKSLFRISKLFVSFLKFLFGNKQNKEKVIIRMFSNKRNGLVGDISAAIYKLSIELNYFKGWAPPFVQFSYFKIMVLVNNPGETSRLFENLKQIEGVHSVRRVGSKGWTLLFLGLLLSIFLYFSTPLLSQFFGSEEMAEELKWLSPFFEHIGYLLPMIVVMGLTFIYKSYFPTLRNSQFLWGLSFVLLTVASIYVYMSYIDQESIMSWIVYVLMVFLSYMYLSMNFLKIKKFL